MNITLEPQIYELNRWFSQTRRPLYQVGGCVRNALLGVRAGDTDVCAAVHPEQLEPLANDVFRLMDGSYGLGTVVIVQTFHDIEYKYEYTAFRRDSYGRGGEHRPQHVFFTEDIVEDASRRDFTVNALYADPEGMVIDPLGVGVADLEAKIIRMCGPETLTDDALRILRMVRFSSQLGFPVEKGTLAAAIQNAHKLADISAERIRDELFCILMADTRYGNRNGVLNGLHLLHQSGALAHILPELLAGEDFEQSAQYHAYRVMEHNFHACAAAVPDLTVRLAALLHDISKPGVYAEDGNLYRHPQEGAKLAAGILTRLRADHKLTRDVSELIANHMFDLDDRAKKNAVVRMIVKLGKEQFLRLCDLREADFAGSGKGTAATSAQKWRGILNTLEDENAPITKNKLAVDGDDLIRELEIPQGRLVGKLLTTLQIYALKKPSQNNYKSLIRYAKMIVTDIIAVDENNKKCSKEK